MTGPEGTFEALVESVVERKLRAALAQRDTAVDSLLSPREAAAYLGISERSFHRLRGDVIPEPDFVANRIVRWRRSSLDRAIAERGRTGS